MQKIILDTNIVVSALIQKSYPFYIVFDYVLNRHVQLCLSSALLDEYRDVLMRPKFARIPDFESNADFTLTLYKKTQILSPRSFWEKVVDWVNNIIINRQKVEHEW